MTDFLSKPTLDFMRNKIDLVEVPFSNRGSRLLVFKNPETAHLMIKLAERLVKVEPGLETYRRRQPFIDELCLVDSSGNELKYELTTYPHTLILTTQKGVFQLIIVGDHKLVISVPADVTAGVRFRVLNYLGKTDDHGGRINSIRNLSYFSNAEIKTNKMTHRKGCIEVEIIIKGTGVRSIVLDIANDTSQVSEQLPFEQLLQKNLVTWQDWFASVPAVDSIWNEAYSYAWWNMANNLINPQGFVRYEAMMPSKTKYVGLWLWDCAMHAIAFRHIDPELARNQIRVMLACQLPDGMLPDAIFDEGIISEITHPIAARVTKPPILAWAALKIHDIAPDLAFIKEIYPALVRWNAWWFEENDDDSDGIVQYNHPYSSGLDDNPLWDYGMPVESPDINTYLCIQMDSLAVMADLLGFPVEAAEWRSKADELVEKMINHFWDGEAGIFRSLVNHLPVPVVTPFNLYPIWTGRLPEKILKRCLATLTDSKKFWGVHSLPSVSYDDPHFTQETMWRGPVWVNINYFFIEALEKVGEMTLARELRNKTLQLIKEKPGMFEYYNAISGEPPEKAARVFGWTAAVFIDLTIAANKENI